MIALSHSWQNKTMNHVEGGWPAEVKTQAGEIKNLSFR